MKSILTYDKHYQQEDLFGAPYQGLVDFFDAYMPRGKVLDLGCGQGRDVLALAKMGYTVTGVDISQVGIEQMLESAQQQGLEIQGEVADIYSYAVDSSVDIVLLDSILHFQPKDQQKELFFLDRIAQMLVDGGLLCVCTPKGKKREMIFEQWYTTHEYTWEVVHDIYVQHRISDYQGERRMVILKKK